MSPPVSAEIKNVHKGNSFKEEEDSFTFKGLMFRTCLVGCVCCQDFCLRAHSTGNPCSKCSQSAEALFFVESSGISCGKVGAVKPRKG